MNADKLCSDVRHCLDEQGLLSEIEMSLEDALPINQRIETLFSGAFNALQLILPVALLNPIELSTETLEADIVNGIGTVLLPKDYLRLGAFKMQGWKRAVYNTIEETDPLYALQLCDATRGGVINPIVARIAGGEMIQYFSLPKGKAHKVEIATYIPINTSIEDAVINDAIYSTLVWSVAKDVATSFHLDTKAIENIIQTQLVGYVKYKL